MGKAARNRARRARAAAGGEPSGRPRPRTLYAAVAVGAAAVAGALILASILTSGGDDSGPAAGDGATITVAGAAESRALLAGIPQQGIALGRRDAPVTLVEFADLQCPFCAEWSRDALPELVRDYVRPGRVRIVFRGLAFIGQDSEEALRFALAAGEQGKLWNVVDLLYENQGGENEGWVTDDLLTAVGRAVPGLDVERALAERSGAAVDAELAEAETAASESGISGTPSFAVGRTGGTLRVLELDSLDAQSLRPELDALLQNE
jgi:protein-disulfide isomerase